MNINLDELNTSTIKQPKLQETSTLKLLNCFINNTFRNKVCDGQLKQEITAVMFRRVFLPFYIPAIALICSFQLVRSKKTYLNKFSIFAYSFVLVLLTELSVRLTGINTIVRSFFTFMPFFLIFFLYSFLFLKFANESKNT